MIKKEAMHKGIQEEISNQELAIMMTNSFNTVFEEFRSIQKDIAELKLKTNHIDKKLRLIEQNMVTKYEFKSFIIRLDKIEESLPL